MNDNADFHTPGPWVEDAIDISADMKPMDTRDCGYTRIRGANGDLIVADMDVSTPEGEANARLIVAAPSLLKEIANAIDVLDPAMYRHEIVQLRERLIRFRSSIEVV
jgi:hypothetical protein